MGSVTRWGGRWNGQHPTSYKSRLHLSHFFRKEHSCGPPGVVALSFRFLERYHEQSLDSVQEIAIFECVAKITADPGFRLILNA